MNITTLMSAVRGVLRDREIARLLPQASNKTEPVAQRRNPARAAKQAKQAKE